MISGVMLKCLEKSSLILEAKTYSYGCIMAEIPQSVSRTILDFNNRVITEDMLYIEGEEYGREVQPHVTIKYGLTRTYNPESVKRFFSGVKPFPVQLKGLDVFENDQFDVVKFNVDGQELRRLNEMCCKLPNEDKYPVYNPHMTLAYVKPGMGQRFKRKMAEKVCNVVVDTLIYSDRGYHTKFRLI